MKNYIDTGNTITVRASANVAAGVPQILGGLVAMPTGSAKSGEDYTAVLSGVFELDKATGAAWTLGAPLYWDATNKNCVTSAGSEPAKPLVGHAYQAAASTDTVGLVRLSN